MEAPANHERLFRETLPDNDFEDEGPSEPAPEPAPVPSGTVPTVSAGWSEAYADLWKAIAVAGDWANQARAIARKIVAEQIDISPLRRERMCPGGSSLSFTPWSAACVSISTCITAIR